MEFTTTTIIIISVLLFMGIVTPLINPFLRLPHKQEDAEAEDNTNDSYNSTEAETTSEAQSSQPPVSIIIISHDNGPQLKKSLETFLNQDYPTDYEVIVVADEKDSETDDVIKLYSSNKRLYATFMPLSSRYLSRKKLAITLGIKAAHHEWAIITNGYCCPADGQWLKAFAGQLTSEKEVVLGHSIYDHHAPNYYQFEKLRDALYDLKAADGGNPFSIDSPIVAIKKDLFIKEDGFRGNLKFVRGEFAFLINKYATQENCGISVSPNAWIIEETPYKRRWKNKHLYQINILPHLERSLSFRILYNMDMLMMHLCNLAIIAGIAYGIILQNWIVVGAAILSFIIEYVLRAVIAKRATKRFGLEIGALLVPLFEFWLTFCNIGWRVRYLFANKNDFITHKL